MIRMEYWELDPGLSGRYPYPGGGGKIKLQHYMFCLVVYRPHPLFGCLSFIIIADHHHKPMVGSGTTVVLINR
jgi:hypothetical protein